MKIRELRLSDFRNIENAALPPCSGVNILWGDNAQGKTNLLEAVWLFTGSKSFRGVKDTGLVRSGKAKSRLTLRFDAGSRENEAQIEIMQNRKAVLNGVPLESAARLSGSFCAVIFSPEHLGLVKEGPQLRRKFLDDAISPLWPKHAALTANYARTLLNRNALLKDIPRHAELLDTMEIWDERLATAGAQIVFARLRYLRWLLPKAAGIYAGIARESGAGEKSAETFRCTYRDGDGAEYPALTENRRETIESYRTHILENLRRDHAADMESGFTRSGPHRDDLDIEIGEFSARLYASQGQQRSAVLAFKLAEASVMLEKTGEPPVLLLDDVMSELDQKRQDYILNHIEGWQVFITCCDPSAFSGLRDGAVFHVTHGRIEQNGGSYVSPHRQ